jgi:hypothetical protein
MINDIKIFWGDTLQRIPLSNELKALVPDATSSFLMTIGLPASTKLNAEWEKFLRATHVLKSIVVNEELVKQTIPYFEFSLQQPKIIHFQDKAYVAIGYHQKSTLALKAYSGEVYMINPERPKNLPPSLFYSNFFVNSTIQDCLQFLMIQAQYRSLMIKPTLMYQGVYTSISKDIDNQSEVMSAKKQIHLLIDQMENHLLNIDKRALNEDNSWWALFLNDLKHYS